MVGGLAYFTVNQLLVTVAVSLKTGRRIAVLLREDLAYEGLGNGAMLALAPLIALAMAQGALFVPLLLPPLLAVYRVGAIGLERERAAMTDALTGLANRSRLTERAASALVIDDARPGAAGPSDPVLALLLLDLDRFKEVNDTLGHHVGDQLLGIVADRLRAAMRPGDTVARLGGDEFAMLLVGADAARAEQTARRLLVELDSPMCLSGLLVDISASVGVAVSPQHGHDLDSLLQHADVAMYLAKESATGVELYDAGRDRNSTGRLMLMGELRRGLADRELEVHFQPKASLHTERVYGVEALVRWRHPVRGLVPPDEFVPLAESTGQIEALTAFVLDAAVCQLASWRTAGLELKVAVNVSVRDLCSGALPSVVAAALERHAVPARCLQLEVTEGSLFSDSRAAASTLRRLDALGIELSLDDFGTGYSSLGHLRRLPVRELKIDRCFVRRLSADPRDRAIVRSIVDLAGGLGMRVVAEGVEDCATWVQLREMGCDEAQGFYLSRAEPAALLTPWLLQRQAALQDVSV